MAEHEASGGGGIARLPNGSRLELQGRDPRAADVMNDLAKAAAVAVEFSLVLDCTLSEAVALYETVLNVTGKAQSHRLMERARLLRRSMKLEPGRSGGPGKPDRILH